VTDQQPVEELGIVLREKGEIPGKRIIAQVPVAPAPLAAPTLPAQPKEGRLWLTNGDVLSGSLIGITEGELAFQLDLGPRVAVPVERVTRVSLAHQESHPLATPPHQVSARVTLVTGEVWNGNIEQLGQEGLKLGWYGGQTVMLPAGLLHAVTNLEPGVEGLLQWATSAKASSEYRPDRHAAHQATGARNTLREGDLPTAWATREPDDGDHWLELTYATPVRATQVRVWQTLNPGAVVRIDAVLGDDKTLTLWEGRDTGHGTPRWLDVRFDRTNVPIRTIRLHLDTMLVAGWNEIDAVALIGEPEQGQ